MARFGLPAIVSAIPQDVLQFLERVREFIERYRDDGLTRSDLIRAGVVERGPGNTLMPAVDTTPPPAPSGLSASGTLTSIYLTWDQPLYANHGYTKVYRSATNNFSNASVVGSSATRIFTDAAGMGADYYYWIAHVSKSGVEGPVVGSGGGQDGVHATTASDATPMLQLLEQQIDSAHLKSNSITQDKISAGAITSAHIAAGSITGDRIASGTILAANIYTPSLSAISANMGDITAGTITLDQLGFIRSGNISYASTSPGFWMGYSGDAYKFFVGSSAGSYLDWDGTNLAIITPQLQVVNGSASFSGALNAATGTFSGSLNAATGTFSGSLNAATGTFSGSLNAATGTFAGALAAGVLNAAAFDSIRYEYTSPGSYALTVPQMKAGWSAMCMKISIVGAGGGGCGGVAYSSGSYPLFHQAVAKRPGSGGGAGAYVKYDGIIVTPGQPISITVGAGGLGSPGRLYPITSSYYDPPPMNPTPGNNGGITQVVYAAQTYAATSGEGGRSDGTNGAIASAQPGYGGNSYFGTGGTPDVIPDGSSTVYEGSVAGLGAGGGGGAANYTHQGLNFTGYVSDGNPGGNGYVLIEFYDPNTLVLNSRYSNLINWLDTIGHGAVPSNAR